MNIRKIIKEEFDWIKDVNIDDPQLGTAWTILDVGGDSDNSIKVQKYVFSLGFHWGSGDVDVEDYSLGSLQSIFVDNVEANEFTWSPTSDLEDDIRIIRKDGDIEELYVYKWDGNKTSLIEIVKDFEY